MTIQQFNQIIEKAMNMSPSDSIEEAVPFSCGSYDNVDFYDVGNYRVKKVNGEITGILDVYNNVFIREKDCTTVNLDSYSNHELEDLMKQIKNEIQQRKVKESETAIKKFNEAWQELQKYDDVRIRVTLDGDERAHKHVAVKDLKLRILPVRAAGI